MQVTFRTNVGKPDAESLGLDYTKCQAGRTLSVADELAAKLLKRGLIEPVELRAVPPQAMQAGDTEEVEEPTELEEGSVEKAEADLKAYRRKARREKKGE